MNKDNRISNLPETQRLLSDQVADPFPHQAKLAPPNNHDDNALLLISRSGSHNEKIKFKNFKKSVLDGANAVFLTGNQLISGEKTFADVCTFQSTIYINEVIDITQTGDISGNIFVGETGLFEKMGVGLDFTDRRIIKDVFMDFPRISGGYSSYNYGGGIDPYAISEDEYKYYLINENGDSYLFSGDATGFDPNIQTQAGDSLVFLNQVSGVPLSINDSAGQQVANEISGELRFKANNPGKFYYQSSSTGHQSLSGQINVINRLDSAIIDFSNSEQAKITTSLKSFPIYEPSGYYNSNTSESQQNWGSDTSLDGHSLSPDEIHREMGGAWHQINFEEPFHYKGFSLFRKGLKNCAEDLKIVASNNGTEWKTIHNISGLESSDYQTKEVASTFTLDKYHPETYSKYRVVAEKIISGNFWEVSHFNISGLVYFDQVRTVNPLYTLHVSGDSCFLGGITNTGYHRQEGDSYRIGDSNLLGDLRITGDSWRFGDMLMDGNFYLTGNFVQTGDSSLYGDKLIFGDLTHTGYHRQKGDSYKIGNSNLLGDFQITGNSWRYGDMRMLGDYRLTGDFTQSGNSLIYGDEKVTGDIHVGEYIYHYEDEDTFVRFGEDEISIEAGGQSKILLSETEDDFISFSTSGIEQARLTNEGYFGINTENPIGELSVTGGSYLEKAFTTGEDGHWERIFGGSDEVITFVASLNKGKDSYYLDFPKTFGEKPAVTLSLENSNGGPIVPYMISGLNEFRFAVNFGSELKDDEYKLHINARPTGQSSANKTTTQSFTTDIPEGADLYEIFYPHPFHAIPSVSTAVESESNCIPYLISGVSRDSYYVILSSPSKPGYTIHTHAVR